MHKCPKCGFETDSRFCPECGYSFVHRIHRCPKCGFETDGKFCPECGFSFIHRVRRCPKCGFETDGKYCPECGHSFVQQIRNCPVCGFEADSKFCPECGYSFVQSEAEPNSTAKRIKSHLKVLIPLVVAIVVVIILCCSIPSCIKEKPGVTYYKLDDNGELDNKIYYVLKSDKWTDEDGKSGAYKLDGENIVLYYTIFGETEEICGGILNNYVLKVNGGTYVSESHTHKYGEWETIRDVTESTDGLQVSSCICGKKKEIVLPATGTSGLEYKLINGDTAYAVSGIGTATGTEIVIPSMYKGLPVTSIGRSAFDSCRSLTSVTIPDSVTDIGSYSFWGCIEVKSITIPDSVTTIGSYSFAYCIELTDITFNGTTAQWDAITKDIAWNYFTGNFTVHCTDGNIQKG